MIKAVIFDMDGVISKTQQFHSGTESELLEKLGIHITSQEIINRYAGTPDRLTFKYILDEHGVSANIQDLLQKKWQIMEEKIKNNLHPIDGVVPLVKNLFDNHFLLAVASTSPHTFIKRVLQEVGVKQYFPVITSGDEVKLGKPNPEIFLLTAQRLKVAPRDCLIIEDATNGVRAAKAAGMKCIAITTTHERERLNEADLIIDSFSELTIDIIRNI